MLELHKKKNSLPPSAEKEKIEREITVADEESKIIKEIITKPCKNKGKTIKIILFIAIFQQETYGRD